LETPRITFDIDAARHLIVVTVVGDVGGTDYERFARALARDHAGVMGYRRLYDLRDYVGTVSHTDVSRMNDMVLRETGVAPSEAVVVTRDRGFALWARAMEATLAPPRRIRVVPTMEEAWALLAG